MQKLIKLYLLLLINSVVLTSCIFSHKWSDMEGIFYVTYWSDEVGDNVPYIQNNTYLFLEINDSDLTGTFSISGYTFGGEYRDILSIEYWLVNEAKTELSLKYDGSDYTEITYQIVEYGKTLKFEYGDYGRIIFEK